MTSTFSIAKQKALELFGQVAITNDAVYSSLRTNITLLCETVNGLRDRVSGLVTQYQEVVSLSCDMSRAIHGLYDGSGQQLETASSANASNKKHLRDELLPAIKAAIQDKVINDIEAWATELDSLQSKMNSREECRVRLDHFKSKIIKVRASRDQYLQRGRTFPRKEADKLERNERKLENARLEFQGVNETCCDLMQTVWNRRFSNLNTVFINLIHCEENLSALVNASAHACVEPIRSTWVPSLAVKDPGKGNTNRVLSIENGEAQKKQPNVFELFGATPPIITEPTTPTPPVRQPGSSDVWDMFPTTAVNAGAMEPFANTGPDNFTSEDPFTSFKAEPVTNSLTLSTESRQQCKSNGNIRDELFADWPI
uniref:BAR domain-containing protein n=1 Tax=Spongospora subterranea TaxID=70186 RepID=A0A0H5R8U1_9EUKA|eukprot:CRZ10137.1 hypothetical protein [Spongospora subterranea]